MKRSIVYMSAQKPSWFGEKQLCLFRKDISLVLMHLSNYLETLKVRAIGL